MTNFQICQVECRRIVFISFLSVCGLDISAIYGAWFRVLVIGLQLAIRVCDEKWYVVLGSCH